MSPAFLEPSLDLLRQEFVLVQAWKKASNYIRYHNWYADTLDLDWTTVNLPRFIDDLRQGIETPEHWKTDPLRLVSAPKSQRWHVSNSGDWAPVESGAIAARLRPLAHVSLRDQVVATALMLCLADRVESRQGDPRDSYAKAETRKTMSSYGNRLFCDTVDGELRHRWGSTKLYRSFFQDYRSFVQRPTKVAESLDHHNDRRIFIIESDLRQFYDRVRAPQLKTALQGLQRDVNETDFFSFAETAFDWVWDDRDTADIATYSQATGIDDFTRVSLPQGLVSAGFFANLVLISFDEAMREKIGDQIAPSIHLEDTCRYVDDLRLVVSATRSAEEVQINVCRWLQELLDNTAHGLLLSEDKTKIAEVGGSQQRPFVRQSRRMDQIQQAVSGGFDAIAGAEILDAVQGLMRSQEALRLEPGGSGWEFSPMPDVRDETVARFSAGRFRTTYRSVRPLLDGASTGVEPEATDHEFNGYENGTPGTRTKQDLDDDARTFALNLIERWIVDPSNVRLLRIGLDIWPAADVLEDVLAKLRPFVQSGGKRKAPRRVAWYCLGEILRAAVTETGFVADSECLPERTDLERYRNILGEEAARLVDLPARTIPWYLRQQALLVLAAFDPDSAPIVRVGRSAETTRYRKLILFLRGQEAGLTNAEFATLTVLSRRAFPRTDSPEGHFWDALSAGRRRDIAVRDPSLARELGASDAKFVSDLPGRIQEDLCFGTDSPTEDFQSLASVVLDGGPNHPLRNELSLLRFSQNLLESFQDLPLGELEGVSPRQVQLQLACTSGIAEIVKLRVTPSRFNAPAWLYAVPDWCQPADRWRFRLGFLLRFILSRQPDFTVQMRSQVAPPGRRAYYPSRSHWRQRLYGLFNAQEGFGDDWLPLSDWMEQFLLALLHWPGCPLPATFEWVEQGINRAREGIVERISCLEAKVGAATTTLILPMVAGRPTMDPAPRPLRACVVQTIIPDDVDPTDLACSEPNIRRKHRNHLSAALAAVRRMIDLRDTHDRSGRRGIDWLILPELAVHPTDVRTHLVPFARAYKTLILTGLTYQELFPGDPLVNSALWIIPEWTHDHGLRIRIRRQGKQHLAPNEQLWNLQGFRPCQWLIGYTWSEKESPLWMTGSVCYDATDLGLAADLRNQSDVFAITAFNKDVKTFDQMALALHYHMFQLIVVANNGKYGGSNAYWPTTDPHKRQIFHMHGQPQASIAFLDIDVTEMMNFLARQKSAPPTPKGSGPLSWKYPPAGMGRP